MDKIQGIYIVLFVFFLILIISYFYQNKRMVLEGNEPTQCHDYTDCGNCVSAIEHRSGTPCYWKLDNQTCVTMSDSNTVDSCPQPTPIPIPTPSHPTPIPTPSHPTPIPTPSHPTPIPTPSHPTPAHPTPSQSSPIEVHHSDYIYNYF